VKEIAKICIKTQLKTGYVCLTLMRKEIEKICIETPTQNQTNSHEKEIEKICIKTPTQNQTWCV
jgi:hypothetical protein